MRGHLHLGFLVSQGFFGSSVMMSSSTGGIVFDTGSLFPRGSVLKMKSPEYLGSSTGAARRRENCAYFLSRL